MGPKPPIPLAFGSPSHATAAQCVEEGGSAGQAGRMTGRSFSNGRLHKACTPQKQPALTQHTFQPAHSGFTNRPEVGAQIISSTVRTQKIPVYGRATKYRHVLVKPKCTTVLRAPHSHGERREYTTIRPFHLTPEHSEKKNTSFNQNENASTTGIHDAKQQHRCTFPAPYLQKTNKNLLVENG